VPHQSQWASTTLGCQLSRYKSTFGLRSRPCWVAEPSVLGCGAVRAGLRSRPCRVAEPSVHAETLAAPEVRMPTLARLVAIHGSLSLFVALILRPSQVRAFPIQPGDIIVADQFLSVVRHFSPSGQHLGFFFDAGTPNWIAADSEGTSISQTPRQGG
jgi:hypothetical protein